METLIVHTSADKLKAVKAVLKAMGVSFEKASKKGGSKKAKEYNPEFVAKIKQGEQDLAEGKGVRMKVEDLWK